MDEITIEELAVFLPYGLEVHVKYKGRAVRTPKLDKELHLAWWLKTDQINDISGTDMNNGKVIGLLRKARYNAKPKRNNFLEITWPSYRQDILHPVVVIEDIFIAYSYNNIEPVLPELAVVGLESEIEKFSRKVRGFLPVF